MPPESIIILFDGNCVACSRGVRFVYRRDPGGQFRFAAQDTEVGRELLGGALPGEVVVLEGERRRGGADAILFIAGRLGWPWRAIGVLRVLPRGLREGLYQLVARNRYRLFGRLETCFVPADALRTRFVSPGDLPAALPPRAAPIPAA